MKIGIIGYGSMGKMLLWKFSEKGKIEKSDLLVSNRTKDKLVEAKDIAEILDNRGVASNSDIVFLCVRPSDLKTVLEEIKDTIRPETLITYDANVTENDKRKLKDLLGNIGDVICASALEHTSIPKEQIIKMVLSTMTSTGDLMLRKEMAFEDVVNRVATKGGITEEGTKVIYKDFPAVSDLLFKRTLEKRCLTTEKAEKDF